MEEPVIEPVEVVEPAELELKPLIIESKEEQIQEKLFTLFYPATNGNLGRRNEKLARQIADLIKKNPELIWVMINELEKHRNSEEGAHLKNAHQRVKQIFQILQKFSFLKGSRFRALAREMENWPNEDLRAFQSFPLGFFPNSHAKAWEGIVSFKKQDNPWDYHL
jgi:hypothetical protein